MKADIRRGIGTVYIVVSAETPDERALLGLVAERRDWKIDSKTSIPISGVLEMREISLAPVPEWNP